MSLTEPREEVTPEQTLEQLYKLIRARAEAVGLPERVLRKYHRGAREAMKRIVSETPGDRYLRLTFLSSKASERGPETTIVVKDLEGRLRKVSVGTPIEESYHHVVVSEYVMKCDCPSALRTATRADRWLENYIKRTGAAVEWTGLFFSKHVLCKHTLAGLARAIWMGVVPVSDQLVENIGLALTGLAIAEGVVPRRSALSKVLSHLRRPGGDRE